ncbi:hypothetical protein [Bradyrhizobium sp. USDA 3458]|uniref:hypothetical protein n=1 Tax=Bradyrhizobium sp. USDA 3458 TaxID=2591461 RepID=UPI0011416D68|nr:hypothetical protein [Bradyrhizobium sp. USDA 3458]
METLDYFAEPSDRPGPEGRREDQVTPARTASPMLDRFTKPADFLKLKAAIQDATQPAERSNGVSAI